jgi:hypothetical protein
MYCYVGRLGGRKPPRSFFCRIWSNFLKIVEAGRKRHGTSLQLDQNSLADEMRTRGNERVSVRQGYGYGCRYGTLNDNLFKTARTCCSLEACSADFRPFVHDLNTSRPKCAPLVGGISVHCVTRQAVLVDLYLILNKKVVFFVLLSFCTKDWRSG